MLSTLRAKFSRFKGTLAAIAAGGAVLSGLVGYYTAYKTVAGGGMVPSRTTASDAAINPLSLIVLPLTNQTGDAGKSYIAEALSDSITADLARIRDAFVVSAATARIYKDKPLSVQQIGQDAGVRYVLSGAVQSSGQQVRILAQLSDAQSGAQFWSESFESELTDLFALQNQLTLRIGTSMGRELIVRAARASESRKSGSARVADLLLQARALSLQPQSLDNWRAVEALYRKVLKLEPGNLTAQTELAVALVRLAINFGDALAPQTERLLVEARDMAQHVRSLDPDNPRAIASVAAYALRHGDLAEYRRLSEQRLALDPKDPSAYVSLALSYSFWTPDPEHELEILLRALQLDARHPYDAVLNNLSIVCLKLGRADEAIAYARRVQDIRPGTDIDDTLAMAYALKGDDEKAREAANAWRRRNPGGSLGQPEAWASDAYKKSWLAFYPPLWRKAGLPE